MRDVKNSTFEIYGDNFYCTVIHLFLLLKQALFLLHISFFSQGVKVFFFLDLK